MRTNFWEARIVVHHLNDRDVQTARVVHAESEEEARLALDEKMEVSKPWWKREGSCYSVSSLKELTPEEVIAQMEFIP